MNTFTKLWNDVFTPEDAKRRIEEKAKYHIDEPYYPVNNDKNNELYNKYKELADKEKNVSFGGRLGLYKYYDMDDTIEAAFNLLKTLN